MSGDFRLRALREVFSAIPDPRHRRGCRHPFDAILSLVFLGLVCRIREFATLQAWAELNWERCLAGAYSLKRTPSVHVCRES